MALANFIEKMNLAASQIFKSSSVDAFHNKLLNNCIEIRFGNNAIETFEGRVALDLLIRILSRLYPNILINSQVSNNLFVDELKGVAKKIDPLINLDLTQKSTCVINAGFIEEHRTDLEIPVINIGSDNWRSYHSISNMQNFGLSQNPFGAAISACIGCANLFRIIFSEELNNPELDKDLCFSTFNQVVDPTDVEPSLPAEMSVDFTLVGTGAIGNSLLWSFLNLKNIKGRISIIDNQNLDLSNLQRYILMFQEHVPDSKVKIIKELFESINRYIRIDPYKSNWQEVIHKLDLSQLKVVASALDTPIDRIHLQSALPEKILNAWTSAYNIGISRHLNFETSVCLACLYLPSKEVKSESQKIADALNISNQEPTVSHFLANNLAIDDDLIKVLHENGIELEKLIEYKGQSLRVLYSEGVCGGRIISTELKQDTPQDMEVPLAHESAFAGIMLALEVLVDSLQLRKKPIEPLTKIDLFKPFHKFLREKEDKSYTGRCLCQDPIFQKKYHEKWLIKVP